MNRDAVAASIDAVAVARHDSVLLAPGGEDQCTEPVSILRGTTGHSEGDVVPRIYPGVVQAHVELEQAADMLGAPVTADQTICRSENMRVSQTFLSRSVHCLHLSRHGATLCGHAFHNSVWPRAEARLDRKCRRTAIVYS